MVLEFVLWPTELVERYVVYARILSGNSDVIPSGLADQIGQMVARVDRPWWAPEEVAAFVGHVLMQAALSVAPVEVESFGRVARPERLRTTSTDLASSTSGARPAAALDPMSPGGGRPRGTRTEIGRAVALRALDLSGFAVSPRSARVYRHPDLNDRRIVLTKHVARVEYRDRMRGGREWRLKESFRFTSEATRLEGALKSLLVEA